MALAVDQRPIPDIVVARGVDDEQDNIRVEQVALLGEIVGTPTRSADRFRKPGQYAQAGIPVHLRVGLEPLHVVAYELGPDGVYVEVARAEPGELLQLERPFPFTLDPASLLR